MLVIKIVNELPLLRGADKTCLEFYPGDVDLGI
jgi:hypothetical protein